MWELLGDYKLISCDFVRDFPDSDLNSLVHRMYEGKTNLSVQKVMSIKGFYVEKILGQTKILQQKSRKMLVPKNICVKRSLNPEKFVDKNLGPKLIS